MKNQRTMFATRIAPDLSGVFRLHFVTSNTPDKRVPHSHISFAHFALKIYLKSRLMFKLSCCFNYKFLDAVKCDSQCMFSVVWF